MNNAEVKTKIMSRLSKFLEIISNLNIIVQLIGVENLENLHCITTQHRSTYLRSLAHLSRAEPRRHHYQCIIINDWIELPNGSFIVKFLQLPTNQGWYGIPSLKTTEHNFRLSLRYIFKHNESNDLRNIYLLLAGIPGVARVELTAE